MWPPFISITSSTLLHIESMSFLHISFTSGSRNRTWITISNVSIFVVQFNLRIWALIMAHKFSIGLKSGESPGQSNNLNFSIHKNNFVTLELWLKHPITIRKPPTHGWNQSSPKYFDVLHAIHHSFNWMKQPKNMTFSGCLGACWMWPDLRGSSDEHRMKFDLYPCT